MTSLEQILGNTESFGAEFNTLTQLHKDLIVDDFIDATTVDLVDYRKRIGKGNLLSYAKCLEILASKSKDK